MKWALLGTWTAFCLGMIAALVVIILLFPVARWIGLGLAVIAIAAILFFIKGTRGGKKMEDHNERRRRILEEARKQAMSRRDIRERRPEDEKEGMTWQARFLIWLVIAAVIAVVSGLLGGILLNIYVEDVYVDDFLIEKGQIVLYGTLGIELITIALLARWGRKCFQVIGTVERPAQAVLARLGVAKETVGPGLYFKFWPIEDFKVFPTWQYQSNITASDIHSRASSDHATTKMNVDTAIYWMWPRWDEEYDEFNEQGTVIGRISGKELLRKAYYAVRADPYDAEEMKWFFEPGVQDGARRVMATKDHRQCREEKARIEEEIKNYFLAEVGNPFKEAGIPSEKLDVAITAIHFSDELEKAFTAPEIAKRESEAIEEIIQTFTAAGVDPTVAGMLVRPLEGKGMSFDQLRDLAIFRAMSGFGLGDREIPREQLQRIMREFVPQDKQKEFERRVRSILR